MANKLFVVIIAMSIIIMVRSQFREFFKCGAPNPEKESHCTKYGTDSDFLCCYVKATSLSTPVCALISYASAAKIGIKGTLTASDGTYYSCGNVSFFLKFTPVLLGLIAFIF